MESESMRNRLRELRKNHGWTMEQLAEMAETSQQQIQRLETGQRQLNNKWIERFSDIFDISPAELFEPDERNKREQAILNKWRELSKREQDAFETMLGIKD